MPEQDQPGIPPVRRVGRSPAGPLIPRTRLVETVNATRVTQAPVEAVVQAVPPKARVTQAAVETLILNTPPKARFTQAAVEVIVQNLQTKARVSQAVVEAIYRNPRETVWFQVVD